MKVVDREISSIELAGLKCNKQKLNRKVLSDSIVICMLTFFGLILLLLALEKLELITPSRYLKPILVGLSFVAGAIYYLKKIKSNKKEEYLNNRITQYTFVITEYFYQCISNTEYQIYVCNTTENKVVIFQTSNLPDNIIHDTLIVNLLNGKIISINSHSTGKTVNKLNLNKRLIDYYDKEFYLLDKDIQNV
jgi:hypothetical protein